MQLRLLFAVGILGLGGFASKCVLAGETISYSYDAKGRLVKVERAGAVNNGVVSQITHDKAGNRRRLKVSGAP